MVYDLVDLVKIVDGIIVAECQKHIVIPILYLIIRNKVDRFKVKGFFLYLPTNWYHTKVGLFRAVTMREDTTCK